MSTHSSSSGALDSKGKELVAEAESLVQRLADSKLGEQAKVLVARLKDGVDTLKSKSEDAVELIKDKAAQAQEQVEAGVEYTEKAIKKNPWTAVGIAAGAGLGIGLVIGLLIRRD